MKKQYWKYAVTFAVFIAAALVVEVAILITTKVVGWDNAVSGRPWVAAVHVHLLVLGALWHLLLAVLDKTFDISGQKLAKAAYIVFLIGLSLLVATIMYKGFSQLLGAETIRGLREGGSAIAHTTLFVGLFLWVAVILKSVLRTANRLQ